MKKDRVIETITSPVVGKIQVTKRAVVQRLNRRLAKDDESLRKARSVQTEISFGEYFIIDNRTNALAYRNIDIEELAREYGVLKPYEELMEE